MELKSKIALFACSCTIFISACKKKEVIEFTDTPIIESYLEPGDYFNLKVSRQIPFSSNLQFSSDDINLLDVKVSYNNTTHTLTPLGNGEYIDSSLKTTEGIQYFLSFSFNLKNVSAYTQIPSKPLTFSESVNQISLQKIDSLHTSPGILPDPILLTWINSDASYYLVVIENIETNPEPIRDFGNGTAPPNRFREQPVTSSGQQINAREFRYFGRHRVMLYHVLPDYATLYDKNSVSSLNLTNPSTSIVNGYGIFTGMNPDTLYINVKKI